jgi:hypothetical protein
MLGVYMIILTLIFIKGMLEGGGYKTRKGL